MKQSSRILRRIGTICLLGLLAPLGWAQFTSGSTGADGALNVTTNQSVALPADGILNYTTIDVANGVTLTFTRNAKNTPVILLATGDVNIQGTINVSGASGRGYGDALAGTPGSEAQGGPGGFRGGIGAVAVINGGTGIATPGGGPGGGLASTDPSATGGSNHGRGGNAGSHFTAGGIGNGNAGAAAPTYGDPRLLTLEGGSGGAGANVIFTSTNTYDGAGGGAGGGAILIASSGTVTVGGSVSANGGGGSGGFGAYGGGSEGSGGGAGGTVRILASQIAGNGSISAIGGGGAATGGNGKIALEAFNFSGNIANSTNPPPVVKQPSVTYLDPAGIPTIRIATIGGQTVPDPATGSTTSPDVTIPSATTNPLTIGIATTGIPDGSVIHLRIVQQDGSVLEADSDPVAASSASASVSLSTGVGVIYATATFPAT